MKIPRNLKQGDRLWYSKTRFATVTNQRGTPYTVEDQIHALAVTGPMWYNLQGGEEIFHDTEPVVRVERIRSKKPARIRIRPMTTDTKPLTLAPSSAEFSFNMPRMFDTDHFLEANPTLALSIEVTNGVAVVTCRAKKGRKS